LENCHEGSTVLDKGKNLNVDLRPFYKVVPKVKKEAPASPKAQARANVLKTKKAVHPQLQKKDPHVTHLPVQDTGALEAAQIPSEEQSQEKSVSPLCHCQVPLTTESTMKTEDNTLVFVVDVKTNKHQIKQAVKTLYGIDVVKANFLTVPDGVKRACVGLALANVTLVVANNSSII
jgi:large subunit ribosomal protein L23Ae